MIPAAVLAVGAAEDPAEEPEEAGAEELEEQAGVEARHLQGDPGETLGPHRPQVAPLAQVTMMTTTAPTGKPRSATTSWPGTCGPL